MKSLITTSLVVALAVAGILTGSVSAEEILLNSGSGIEGTITSIDHESMSVRTDDGETVRLNRGAVDPHFYYSAWTRKMDKTAENHLRVAVFAFENGLFNQARSQYRKAQRLDKDMVKKFEEEIVPKIKEGVAQKLLGMAQAAVAAKEWRKAETIAAKLLTRLPDTAAAEQARKVIGEVHTWELDDDQQRLIKRLQTHLPRDEKEAARERTRIAKRAEPIERGIESARKSMNNGLKQSSANRSKGLFESAAKKFETQVRAVDRLMKEAAGDAALVAYLQELRVTAVREGVDAWIAAGNVNLSRGSYNNAKKQGEAALKLDPDSVKAKKFVAEVKEQERYNSDFFTTVARGGRPGGGRRR